MTLLSLHLSCSALYENTQTDSCWGVTSQFNYRRSYWFLSDRLSNYRLMSDSRLRFRHNCNAPAFIYPIKLSLMVLVGMPLEQLIVFVILYVVVYLLLVSNNLPVVTFKRVTSDEHFGHTSICNSKQRRAVNSEHQSATWRLMSFTYARDQIKGPRLICSHFGRPASVSPA